MTDAEELIAIVEQADRTMTPGEWLYRPEQYDDWGAIRLAKPSDKLAEMGFRYGSPIASVSVARLNNYELQQHRTAGTDPCEGDGKGITALRNNAGAIVQTLRRLTAWKAEAMTVLGEWEKTWEAAGKPGEIGGSKANAVGDLVRRLTQERDEAIAERDKYKEQVARIEASEYLGASIGVPARKITEMAFDALDEALEMAIKENDRLTAVLAAERERREKAEREREAARDSVMRLRNSLADTERYRESAAQERDEASSERDALRERCAELEAKLLK